MNHLTNLQSHKVPNVPLCILVVDDDPTIRALYSEILADEGYGVQTAENGQEAITQIHAHPTDLIMMDIMMPVMDGLTACAKIKADPEMQGVPIVIMSAGTNLRQHADKISCMAEAVLPKPIDLDYLLDTVKRLIEAGSVHRSRPGPSEAADGIVAWAAHRPPGALIRESVTARRLSGNVRL